MVHVDALSCLPWRAGPSTQRVLARRQAGWVHARRPRHEEAPGPAGAGHAGAGTDIDHPTGRSSRTSDRGADTGQIWIGGLGVLLAAAPPTVNLGAGGDYGYDEAHDIGAS